MEEQKEQKEQKAAPAFEKSQLLYCRALGASPDILAAVLEDGKAYTLGEAQEAINKYLNRKV